MLTKSAVLRVHPSPPLRGARPQGHRASHYLQRITPPPFQHIYHPRHRPTQSFRPSSDGCRHLTTLSPTCSPCRPFGPVQEITYLYTLSLDDIVVFIWDSLPNQGRDDPITIAPGVAYQRGVEVLGHVENIRSWREGRSRHHTRTWRPSIQPRSSYTHPRQLPPIHRTVGQIVIEPIRSKPFLYRSIPNLRLLADIINRTIRMTIHWCPAPARIIHPHHHSHAGTSVQWQFHCLLTSWSSTLTHQRAATREEAIVRWPRTGTTPVASSPSS